MWYDDYYSSVYILSFLTLSSNGTSPDLYRWGRSSCPQAAHASLLPPRTQHCLVGGQVEVHQGEAQVSVEQRVHNKLFVPDWWSWRSECNSPSASRLSSVNPANDEYNSSSASRGSPVKPAGDSNILYLPTESRHFSMIPDGDDTIGHRARQLQIAIPELKEKL